MASHMTAHTLGEVAGWSPQRLLFALTKDPGRAAGNHSEWLLSETTLSGAAVLLDRLVLATTPTAEQRRGRNIRFDCPPDESGAFVATLSAPDVLPPSVAGSPTLAGPADAGRAEAYTALTEQLRARLRHEQFAARGHLDSLTLGDVVTAAGSSLPPMLTQDVAVEAARLRVAVTVAHAFAALLVSQKCRGPMVRFSRLLGPFMLHIRTAVLPEVVAFDQAMKRDDAAATSCPRHERRYISNGRCQKCERDKGRGAKRSRSPERHDAAEGGMAAAAPTKPDDLIARRAQAARYRDVSDKWLAFIQVELRAVELVLLQFAARTSPYHTLRIPQGAVRPGLALLDHLATLAVTSSAHRSIGGASDFIPPAAKTSAEVSVLQDPKDTNGRTVGSEGGRPSVPEGFLDGDAPPTDAASPGAGGICGLLSGRSVRIPTPTPQPGSLAIPSSFLAEPSATPPPSVLPSPAAPEARATLRDAHAATAMEMIFTAVLDVDRAQANEKAKQLVPFLATARCATAETLKTSVTELTLLLLDRRAADCPEPNTDEGEGVSSAECVRSPGTAVRSIVEEGEETLARLLASCPAAHAMCAVMAATAAVLFSVPTKAMPDNDAVAQSGLGLAELGLADRSVPEHETDEWRRWSAPATKHWLDAVWQSAVESDDACGHRWPCALFLPCARYVMRYRCPSLVAAHLGTGAKAPTAGVAMTDRSRAIAEHCLRVAAAVAASDASATSALQHVAAAVPMPQELVAPPPAPES